jgi:hypothetical protein
MVFSTRGVQRARVCRPVHAMYYELLAMEQPLGQGGRAARMMGGTEKPKAPGPACRWRDHLKNHDPDYMCTFMQYAESDVWHFLECSSSANG